MKNSPVMLNSFQHPRRSRNKYGMTHHQFGMTLSNFGFILITFLLLTTLSSCENFLKNGQDVKDEVLDAIAYNNAQECTVVFRADAETGVFLGSYERTYKVGYESQVQFELNTSDYVFKGLKAVSQDGNKTSRADCVEITELSKDEKKGIYKFNVKLLKNVKDVLIYPECVALPKILEISPAFESNGCDQDKEIKIKFNKALNEQSFKEKALISIYSETESLSQKYFGEPYLSNDGTTVFVRPTEEKLLDPNGDQSSMSVFVNYDFSQVLDEDGIAAGASGTYEYRIRKEFHGQKLVKVFAEGSDGITLSLRQGESVNCTIGHSIDLNFFLDTTTYALDQLQAVSYDDQNTSLIDAVKVDAIEDAMNPGKYQAHVWVKEETTDIIIKIKTLALPCVQDYLPKFAATGVTTDKVITITFNTPMEQSKTDNVKDKVKIEIYGTDVSHLFYAPELNEAGTILTIKPKFEELAKFIENDMKAAFADVNIYFENSASAKIGGKTYYLKQDSKSNFTIRYKNEMEKTAPAATDFFVTSFQVTLEDCASVTENDDRRFATQALNFSAISTDSNFLKNASGGTVYIYGKYLDVDSGVNTVIVNEALMSGGVAGEGEITGTYMPGSENAEFYKDQDGNNYFCIAHNLKNNNSGSAVQLSVLVKDLCGNSSETQTYTVIIKKEFGNPYNVDLNAVNSIESYNNSLKTINFAYENLNNYLYSIEGDSYPIPFEQFELYCEYVDKTGNAEPKKFDIITIPATNTEPAKKVFSHTLNIDSVSDFKFTVSFSIKRGYKCKKEYHFTPTKFPIDTFSYNQEDNEYFVSIKDETALGFKHNYKFTALSTTAEGVDIIYVPNMSSGLYIPQAAEGPITNYYLFYDNNGLCSELVDANECYEEFLQGNNEIQEVEIKSITKVCDDSPIINVVVELEDDTWEKFDSLTYKIWDTTDWASVEKNTYTIVIPVEYMDLLSSRTFEIRGTKGFSSSSGTTQTIEAENPENYYKYDTTKPEVSYDFYGGNYYLRADDEYHGSGMDYVKFTVGETTYTDSQRVQISKSTIDSLFVNSLIPGIAQEVRIPYEVKDKAGNIATGEFLLTKERIHSIARIRITPSDNTTLIFKDINNRKKPCTDEQQRYYSGGGEQGRTMLIRLYGFKSESQDNPESQNNLWESAGSTSFDILDTTNSEGEHYKSFQTTKSNLSKNKFYRILASSSPTDNSFYYDASPQYYYFGVQNTGAYDGILPNGNSTSSVFISSDAPVFVHTLVTNKPYAECSEWDEDFWEQFTQELKPKQLNFSPEEEHTITIGQEGEEGYQTFTYTTGDHSPKRYDIPVDQITEGHCYCVIAYFADGTCALSPVMQK